MKNWKLYAGIGAVVALILLIIFGMTFHNSRKAAKQSKANAERMDSLGKALSIDLINHLDAQANAKQHELRDKDNES